MSKTKQSLRKDRSFEELEQQLKQPFSITDLEWLSNYSFFSYNETKKENLAIAVAPYIRRESVIIRLNEVLGMDGWRTSADPIGTLGVFQYIEVFNGHEWVAKVDGATMKSNEQLDGDESKNKNRDVVKGVISKSIRRAAEAWGIGLYLHFVPQLYAIKRADDCYDSYDEWGKKGVSFKVRWDPPVLPSEFVPRFMTPEQKVRLERMVNYYPEDKSKSLLDMIEAYENDFRSIEYKEAKDIIDKITDSVNERIARVNRFQTYPKIKPTPTKEEKEQGKTMGEEVRERQEEKKEEHPYLTNATNTIEDHKMNELEKKSKELNHKDPDGLWHDKKFMSQLLDAIEQHKAGPPFMSKKIFDEALKKVEKANDSFDADDDDLPF